MLDLAILAVGVAKEVALVDVVAYLALRSGDVHRLAFGAHDATIDYLETKHKPLLEYISGYTPQAQTRPKPIPNPLQHRSRLGNLGLNTLMNKAG